jgi:hypothetical protein
LHFYRNIERWCRLKLNPYFVEEASRTGKVVRLHVVDGNPAQRLYERLGFVTVGEEKPIFPGMACRHGNMSLTIHRSIFRFL